MGLYECTVPLVDKNLANIDRWIDRTQESATARKFDANNLLVARLAPDAYPLVKQIQGAADQAKFLAARLLGREAPSHPDTEKTWDEIRARVASVRDYLKTFAPGDFEGADARLVTVPFMPGKVIAAHAYVHELAIPNFYFHYTTAYQILRHNGVDLGKMDFMGGLPFKDA